ncbi:HPP family protein [Polaromonas sp.]|uniref:HPP family protein n=1 Tax=Polaromonas sp. TaxID=1869339 RepID=UPI003751DEF4
MSFPPPRADAAREPFPARLFLWLQSLRPARTRINARERWRIVMGAFLGILLAGGLSHLAVDTALASLPWLVAPMGASAVLVFGVPSSPLAQPWSVVGGNTLSALVGIACARWLGPPELAAAVAVGVAVGLMLALRCLHPPGGASALMMVLGGITNPWFALFPVLVNSVLLACAGMAWNNATRRPYPHAQRPAPTDTGKPAQVRDAEADLDAVLARYNQVLDVSRDDLQALLEQVKWQAYQRKLAGVRCADVMSRDLVTVTHRTPLEDAWALLRERRIKALPVVDADFRIVGIVTLADFMRAAGIKGYEGMDARLRTLLGAIGPTGKPPVVGQIMTRQVRVAGRQRYLVDLVPLFGGSGHHHIPITGDDGRLVGIITQSDMVAALFEPPTSPQESTP